jgi:hypothetical protein
MFKHSTIPTVCLALLLLAVGCEKDVAAPEFSVTASPTTVSVGEPVVFEIDGAAEGFVIYTGDAGHDYANSYAVVTRNRDLDEESYVLEADALNEIRDSVVRVIVQFNDGIGPLDTFLTPIDTIAAIMALEELVDREFTNRETARYEISLILPSLDRFNTWDYVIDAFTNNSILLEPEGGFSTGEVIDKYERSFRYIYREPGTYTATVIATNTGSKKYDNGGLYDKPTTSRDDYDILRTIREIVITVNP